TRFGPLLRWLGRDRVRAGPEARVEDGRVVLEGLEGDWPPVVEALLTDPTERGFQPIPLRLYPPAAAPGANPLTQRSAALDRVLVEGRAGRHLALLFEAPTGAELAPGPVALPLELPRAEEFRGPERRIADAWLGLGGGSGNGAGDGAGGVSPRSHPAGPGVLAAGLFLLLLAGVLRRL
ncbi:MAG: hypothetical protein O7B99_03630, partial [Planctomycetota bacterium]|nr:hypothetical protein [Planctomycetota bacterium]